MVLSELKYNAVAPPSESSSIPKEVMDNLKARFKRIIVFYDRDSAGMTNTRKIVKEYHVDYMFIHKIYRKKDISDFIKFYKKDKTITLLQNMIK